MIDELARVEASTAFALALPLLQPPPAWFCPCRDRWKFFDSWGHPAAAGAATKALT